MSPDHPAIRVSHLGKKYTIGGPQEKYLTFRDAIASSVKAPFRRFSSHEPPAEFWALKDVSFDVEQGAVVGIIGRNGAGKSTLLKILSRITSPSEGTVDLYGRVGSLLEVGTGFHPELTGRENIFLSGSILGMKRREIDAELDDIVKFSEIEKFLDTPVKRYSSGMYVRLAFAVAAHMDTEILLVDEVLAVGDAQFQKKCLGKMGDIAVKEGRTVLFVSHNMGAITSLCSRAILIAGGKIKLDGNPSSIVSDYLSPGQSIPDSNSLINHPNRTKGLSELLTSFCICSDHQVAYFGEPLGFRIEYQFPNSITVPQFVISFHNLMGMRVFTLISDYQTNNIPASLHGRGEIICRISYLPLMPGDYYINLQLWQPGQKLDEIENVARIQVEWINRNIGQFNWDSGMGVIYIEADWHFNNHNSNEEL